MPTPSPAQRVETLHQELARLAATVGRGDGVNVIEHARIQERLIALATELADLRDKLNKAEEKMAALARRCAALEKGPDSVWQFTPMALSVLAIVLSLVVALIKK